MLYVVCTIVTLHFIFTLYVQRMMYYVLHTDEPAGFHLSRSHTTMQIWALSAQYLRIYMGLNNQNLKLSFTSMTKGYPYISLLYPLSTYIVMYYVLYIIYRERKKERKKNTRERIGEWKMKMISNLADKHF